MNVLFSMLPFHSFLSFLTDWLFMLFSLFLYFLCVCHLMKPQPSYAYAGEWQKTASSRGEKNLFIKIYCPRLTATVILMVSNKMWLFFVCEFFNQRKSILRKIQNKFTCVLFFLFIQKSIFFPPKIINYFR